jgi:hypothetical protein
MDATLAAGPASKTVAEAPATAAAQLAAVGAPS